MSIERTINAIRVEHCILSTTCWSFRKAYWIEKLYRSILMPTFSYQWQLSPSPRYIFIDCFHRKKECSLNLNFFKAFTEQFAHFFTSLSAWAISPWNHFCNFILSRAKFVQILLHLLDHHREMLTTRSNLILVEILELKTMSGIKSFYAGKIKKKCWIHCIINQILKIIYSALRGKMWYACN